MQKVKGTDLERCVTASSNPSNGCQPSSGCKADRHCAIAVQFLDGRAFLIDATITEEVGGTLVFSSAKTQISRAITTNWHQRTVGQLFMGLIVGTARVKQVIHCQPQPQSRDNQGPSMSPPRVFFHDFTFNPLLTEALHNPQLLFQSAAYPLHASYFGSLPTDKDNALGYQPFGNDIDGESTTTTCMEHGDQEVVVVRRVIDRTKVARLLLLLLFFSPALGIGVGICSHDADVGIAVSAGVFALASFVQGIAAWVQG